MTSRPAFSCSATQTRTASSLPSSRIEPSRRQGGYISPEPISQPGFGRLPTIVARTPGCVAWFIRFLRRHEEELWSGVRHAASRLGKRHAELACNVLDELPRDAARSRAACHRPFHSLRVQVFGGDRQFHGGGITIDHGEVSVLVAVMETEP